MLRIIKILVIFTLVVNTIFMGGQVLAAPSLTINEDARSQAQLILARMTPEERIGQLFLVTFQGSDIDPTSQIYDLIVNRHVGGVILRSENNNIPAQDDSNQSLYSFISSLQSIRYEATQMGVVNPQTGKALQPQYVPLFIGYRPGG